VIAKKGIMKIKPKIKKTAINVMLPAKLVMEVKIIILRLKIK